MSGHSSPQQDFTCTLRQQADPTPTCLADATSTQVFTLFGAPVGPRRIRQTLWSGGALPRENRTSQWDTSGFVSPQQGRHLCALTFEQVGCQVGFTRMIGFTAVKAIIRVSGFMPSIGQPIQPQSNPPAPLSTPARRCLLPLGHDISDPPRHEDRAARKVVDCSQMLELPSCRTQPFVQAAKCQVLGRAPSQTFLRAYKHRSDHQDRMDRPGSPATHSHTGRSTLTSRSIRHGAFLPRGP